MAVIQVDDALRVITVPTQAFLLTSSQSAETANVELHFKLCAYPKPDREPVKILVISSKAAITAIVHSLHSHRFAEVFEWTDFLPAPTDTTPLQTRSGEIMKALDKFQPNLPTNSATAVVNSAVDS